MICCGRKGWEEGEGEVEDDLGEYCGELCRELLGLGRSGSIGGTWELVRERTGYDHVEPRTVFIHSCSY